MLEPTSLLIAVLVRCVLTSRLKSILEVCYYTARINPYRMFVFVDEGHTVHAGGHQSFDSCVGEVCPNITAKIVRCQVSRYIRYIQVEYYIWLSPFLVRGARCSSVVQRVVGSILHGVDLMSYFSFQPVLHDCCNKGRGMCYPVCGMVHIKEPLLLIRKSSPCGGSEFPLTIWVVLYHISDAI